MNIALASTAMIKRDTDGGITVIYKGDCGTVSRWDTALHLLINVLGTLLLGASNFTMQCLSAPTRSEVDVAHKKGISLDIGISSFRNLRHVNRTKAALWILLCFTTLPLHLL